MMLPIAAASSAETQLSFTVGAGYIVGRFTVNGSNDLTGPGNGNITSWALKFNNQTVALMKTDSAGTAIEPVTVYNEVIIPPFTVVELISQSNGDSAGRLISALFTGRVYGAA